MTKISLIADEIFAHEKSSRHGLLPHNLSTKICLGKKMTSKYDNFTYKVQKFVFLVFPHDFAGSEWKSSLKYLDL